MYQLTAKNAGVFKTEQFDLIADWPGIVRGLLPIKQVLQEEPWRTFLSAMPRTKPGMLSTRAVTKHPEGASTGFLRKDPCESRD
jgi:hypothetical protein